MPPNPLFVILTKQLPKGTLVLFFLHLHHGQLLLDGRKRSTVFSHVLFHEDLRKNNPQTVCIHRSPRDRHADANLKK